jgi:hypothetical protein
MANFIGTKFDDTLIGPNEANTYVFGTDTLSPLDTMAGGGERDMILFAGTQDLGEGWAGEPAASPFDPGPRSPTQQLSNQYQTNTRKWNKKHPNRNNE